MAQKLKGVSGVLGNLISSPEAESAAPPQRVPPESPAVPSVQVTEQPAKPSPPKGRESGAAGEARQREKKRARLGRPLAGKRTSEPIEREKVSLRLRADLAAAYRDWSWEEHCQFSDLVDKALEFYLKNRGKARKPERE